MSFTSQSRVFVGMLVAGLLVAALAVPASAEEQNLPALALRVSDTTVQAGDTNAWISVFLTNFTDTLAGFTLTLLMSRQDLIEFRTDTEDTLIDTTWQYCIQWDHGACTQWRDTMIVDTIISSGAIDTTGGAIAGWELVTAKAVSGSPYIVKVTGLADRIGPPVKQGLLPSVSERHLFSLKTRVYQTLPESLTNYLTDMAVLTSINETSFSDPHGDLIGTATAYSICDTLYKTCAAPEEYPAVPCTEWVTTNWPETPDTTIIDTFWIARSCVEYLGDSCVHWVDTNRVDADTSWIQPRPWTVVDTNVTFYHDGSLELLFPPPCLCGDANGDETINVGDAVSIINYIFKGGTPPPSMDCADPNNDDTINVGDAVVIINYIFKGGANPYCGF